MSLLYHYDRWRGIAPVNAQSKRLQLAGSPYNAEAGSFSFLLTPELTSGGLYTCDVCLNDHFYSQRTLLSVFQGTDLCENVKQKCIISRVGWGFKQLHILDIDVVLQARAQMAQFSLHAICSQKDENCRCKPPKTTRYGIYEEDICPKGPTLSGGVIMCLYFIKSCQ